MTIETILAAAERGQLNSLLTEHYTIYYDANWMDHLQLCRDLVDDGLIKAEFTEDFNGSPIFLKGDVRINLAGRTHLAKLRKNHFAWRFAAWGFVFATTIVSGVTIALLTRIP